MWPSPLICIKYGGPCPCYCCHVIVCLYPYHLQFLSKCVGQSWDELCPAGTIPPQRDKRPGERESTAGVKGLRRSRSLQMVYDRLSLSSVACSLKPPSIFWMPLWTRRWKETSMKSLKLFSPHTHIVICRHADAGNEGTESVAVPFSQPSSNGRCDKAPEFHGRYYKHSEDLW